MSKELYSGLNSLVQIRHGTSFASLNLNADLRTDSLFEGVSFPNLFLDPRSIMAPPSLTKRLIRLACIVLGLTKARVGHGPTPHG